MWPGDPTIRRELAQDIAKGNPCTVSRYTLGSHTGTHVDAPAHFIPGGQTIDRTPLDALLGHAWVADLPWAEGVLLPEDMRRAGIPPEATRVLLRTHNSTYWAKNLTTFEEDFVSVGLEAAHWLIERGTRLVGIDYLSVETFHGEAGSVHRALLGAGVVIVESLNLAAVPSGWCDLICLPLKLAGADGAPARAVLRHRPT